MHHFKSLRPAYITGQLPAEGQRQDSKWEDQKILLPTRSLKISSLLERSLIPDAPFFDPPKRGDFPSFRNFLPNNLSKINYIHLWCLIRSPALHTSLCLRWTRQQEDVDTPFPQVCVCARRVVCGTRSCTRAYVAQPDSAPSVREIRSEGSAVRAAVDSGIVPPQQCIRGHAVGRFRAREFDEIDEPKGNERDERVSRYFEERCDIFLFQSNLLRSRHVNKLSCQQVK